jgi:hypothetical protein
MAVQTTSAGFLAWPSLEQEYLGLVTASRHVVRTGPVTALATLLRSAAFAVECGLPVRALRPFGVNTLVACLAGVRSHVLGAFRRRHTGRGCASGWSGLVGYFLTSKAWCQASDDEKPQGQKWETSSAHPGNCWH